MDGVVERAAASSRFPCRCQDLSRANAIFERTVGPFLWYRSQPGANRELVSLSIGRELSVTNSRDAFWRRRHSCYGNVIVILFLNVISSYLWVPFSPSWWQCVSGTTDAISQALAPNQAWNLLGGKGCVMLSVLAIGQYRVKNGVLIQRQSFPSFCCEWHDVVKFQSSDPFLARELWHLHTSTGCFVLVRSNGPFVGVFTFSWVSVCVTWTTVSGAYSCHGGDLQQLNRGGVGYLWEEPCAIILTFTRQREKNSCKCIKDKSKAMLLRQSPGMVCNLNIPGPCHLILFIFVKTTDQKLVIRSAFVIKVI